VVLDEDQLGSGNVLSNDITLGAGARAELVSGAAHGLLTLNNDGSYTYQPAVNFNGPDSFSYRIVDAQGRISNTSTVRLSIASVNDAPVLFDTELTSIGGQPTTLDPLANASDVEGDLLTPRIVQVPAHGTLSIGADGQFSYTANPGYVGADGFSYVVNDGQADSRIATVTIAPGGASNDPPTASDSQVQGNEDEPMILRWSDFHVADAQATPLDILIRALPVDGVLQRRLDDGAWATVMVGADTHPQGPVIGIGVRTHALDSVVPFVVECARALGLVVLDDQAGHVYLPDGRTLGPNGPVAPRNAAAPVGPQPPRRAEILQALHAALGPMLRLHAVSCGTRQPHLTAAAALNG
jgi:Bacterial Ig domain